MALGASLLISRDSSLKEIGQIGFGPHIANPTDPGHFLDGPYARRDRSSGDLQAIDWQTAINRVAQTLRRYAPGEIAFLLGFIPNPLSLLSRLLAGPLDGIRTFHFDPLAEFEGRVTLMDAVQKLFGLSQLPLFDLSQADLIYSFGADFSEPWIASGDRKLSRSARLVHFSARRPAGLGRAEWAPIHPGSEAVLTQWLWHSLAGQVGVKEIRAVSIATGLSERALARFAHRYAQSRRRVAIPSGAALSTPDGLAAAQWILSLNLPGRLSAQPPAFSLTIPPTPYTRLALRPSNTAELSTLFTRLRLGKIKALFIHGIDPMRALPESFGVREALDQAEQVISFASTLDATSAYADLLLPDPLPSEVVNDRTQPGASIRNQVSAIRPQAAGRANTRPAADVLSSAIQKNGAADLANDLPDHSSSRLPFNPDENGQIEHALRLPPIQRLQPGAAAPAGVLDSDQLTLQVYPDDTARAKNPHLEIHPSDAARLALQDGERVWVSSPHSQVNLPVQIHSGLHPYTAALAWKPGSACPALDLLGLAQNASGGLIFSGLPVRLAKGGLFPPARFG